MVKRKFSIVMALALALVIMAFSGSVFAQSRVSAEIGGLESLGDTILFSYYDIRTAAQGGPGLSDNYFTVVNTNDDDWKNVHVRVRTGQCSVELLDFDAILSPLDVFTFDLYQGSDGSTVFASCDTHTLVASGFGVDPNGCFVLSSGTFPTMTELIQRCGNCPDGTAMTAATALEATRWGYVEVIGELDLVDADTDCDSDDDCCEEDLIAGKYTMWTWVEDFCHYDHPGEDLYGRVYHAKFDAARNLIGLATSNGISLGDAVNKELIHRPCYSDTSLGCEREDGELENDNDWAPTSNGLNARYAYSAPYESGTGELGLRGATDMNYCFYANNIDADTNLVVNRVGAGATFGPTLADLENNIGDRTGAYDRTVRIVWNLNDYIDKSGATSHYFNIPGQGQTNYVFTFPFQHFVSQRIEVQTFGNILDTEENDCAPPSGKFISPGLPGVVSPKGEVSIITTQELLGSCSFNEGWVALTMQVIRDAVVEDLTVDPDLLPKGSYYPGALGVVSNSGFGTISEVLSTAPMQWWDSRR